MEKMIIPTAEPFFMPGGKTGCVLVHGFTGTPKEMRLMGAYLAEHDLTVLAIRLPGHATDIADMKRVRWKDWLASVEDGIDILSNCCENIFVAGLSLGGILSLLTACIYPINGAIAMATPFSLQSDWRLKFAKQFSIIKPYINKAKSDMIDKDTSKRHVDYDAYPTRSLAEVDAMMHILRAQLTKINIPILLINSRGDPSAPIEHAEQYSTLIPSKDLECVTLEKSGHVVTEDIERQKVFSAALDFINKHKK